MLPRFYFASLSFVIVRPLTDREKQLLTAKKYDAIVHEQKRLDDEIESKVL